MTTTPGSPGLPSIPARERVHLAIRDRARSDYIFDFWTALGWTVLTLGIYSFYIFYQLVRRSRDHNRRRLELLGAAYQDAWDRASEHGRAEEMRPHFERVAAELEALRRMTRDFRDPAIWLLLDIVARGIVWYVGLILLDQDLVRHERHERAAAAGLAAIFSSLGAPVPAPAAAAKQAHNYVARILATIFSLGLYSLWWTYNVMNEGNRNFTEDWAWEDSLAQAAAGG